jgi:hypothetical protein
MRSPNYGLFDSPYWGVPGRLQYNPSAPPGSQNLIGDRRLRKRRRLTPAQVLPSSRAMQEVLSAPNPQFMGGALPQAVMTPQQRQHAMRSRTFNRSLDPRAPAPAPVRVPDVAYPFEESQGRAMFDPEIVGPAAQHARMLQANATQRSRYAGPGPRGHTRSPPPVDEFRGIEPPFVDVGQGDYSGMVADRESLGMKDWYQRQAQEQKGIKDKTRAPRPEDIAAWMQRRRLAIQKEYDKDIIAFQDDEYGATPGGQAGLLERVDDWIRTPTKTGDSAYADTMIQDQNTRIEEQQQRDILGSGTKSIGQVMFPDADEQMAVRRMVSGEKAPVHGPVSRIDEFKDIVSKVTAVPDPIISHTDEHKRFVANQKEAKEESINEWSAERALNASAAAETSLPTVKKGEIKGGVKEALNDAADATGVNSKEAVKTATSTPEQNAERIWGNFSRDSGSKRTKYLSAMNDMYKKMMILNVIAALTGSESQAPLFMEMAMAKMKAMESFDGMERLDSIRKGVFYTEDGKFDPPKSRLTAFRRAIRFGANEKEATSLSGHHPTPSKTTEGFSTWHRIGADGKLQETSVRTKTRPPADGGPKWIKGVGSQSAGTQTDRDRRLLEGLVAAGEDKRAAAIIERDYVDDYLRWSYGASPSPSDTQKHVASRLDLIRRSSPRQAQAVQTTTQQTTAPAVEVDRNSPMHQKALEVLRGDNTEQARKEFLAAFGYLPEWAKL